MPIAAQQFELSPTDIRIILIENGYLPIPVNGKRPHMSGWSSIVATPAAATSWERKYSDHLNTGVLAGNVVAIDVDTLDESMARRLGDEVRKLPDGDRAPCRVGLAPKALYMFRTTAPRVKAATTVYFVNGKKCQVEALGTGQQFVAFGMHPETGMPYEWFGPSPLKIRFDDLPLIEPDDLDRFLERAEDILAETGVPEKKQSPSRRAIAVGESFWQRVNSAALARPEAWVPTLFNGATRETGTGAWRVTSRELGRPLQEDISIHPDGVRDFGREEPETAINLAVEYAGIPTPKDAAFWLCGQLGLDPKDMGWTMAPVGVSFNLNSTKPAPTAANDDYEDEPETGDVRQLPVPPPMHPDPFNPKAAGGLMGDIAQWITSTAIIKVPELSLMSAAALVAALFGGKALGPTSSGVNLFITTIVNTAGGKGRPPKAIRALADRAGCVGAVSNGDPTSFAAFERILRKKPSVAVVLDEFGITLQGVNSKKSDAVAASIRKFLLAIYDQADGVFDGRVYASSETKKDDSPIVGPALTVIGMTTPSTLFKGISEDSVSDGFLNRFVFVEAGDPTEEIRPPELGADHKAPRSLVDALQAAVTAFPKAAGPIPIQGAKYSVPFEGGKGGEAHRAWEAVFLWQHHKCWDQIERDIVGRAAENTIRLATVRAISRDPESPVITEQDVQWGWAIVHRSIQIIDNGVKNMTASDPEALRKAIMEAIRSSRNGEIYRSKLMGRSGVKQASMQEYTAAMAWLYASGKVEDISANQDGSKLRSLPVSG